MVLNGVSFNEKLCLQMNRKEFIKEHVDSCFTDREKQDREKMLGDAYDLMSDNKKFGAE